MDWSLQNNLNHPLISFILLLVIIAAGFLHTFIERRSLRRAVANPRRTVPLTRIHMSRKKVISLATVLIVYGLHAAFFVRIHVAYTIVTGVIAAAGILLLLLLLTGRAASGWVEFRPEGIMVGSFRGQYSIGRSNIDAWTVGEYGSNQAILIRLSSMDEVSVYSRTNQQRFALRTRKNFLTNERWIGAHVFLMIGMYNAPADEIIGTMLQLYGEASTEQIHPPVSS
jgi:hypothetical protein